GCFFQIQSSAKNGTVRAKEDDPSIPIARCALGRITKLFDQLDRERIALVRTVQRENTDLRIARIDKHQRLTHGSLAGKTLGIKSSGTSSVNSSRICPSALPCASIRIDTLPPPWRI